MMWIPKQPIEKHEIIAWVGDHYQVITIEDLNADMYISELSAGKPNRIAATLLRVWRPDLSIRIVYGRAAMLVDKLRKL